MPAAKTNILWICTDQQRYDTIHALGNPYIRTPNLDRLAEQGIAFNHAYAQSPVCTPSRASFLTGRYPRTTLCRQNGQDIPPTERLVTRILADAGYVCGLSGKLHLASCARKRIEPRIDDGYAEFHWMHHPGTDWGEANEYIRWLREKGKTWPEVNSGPEYHYIKEGPPAELHPTTWCVEKAIEFIRRRQGKPWLFSLNIFDPHHPFDPPAEYLRRYDPAKMPPPSYREGELDNKPVFQQRDHEGAYNRRGHLAASEMTPLDAAHVTAAYYAMIELIDDQTGRLLRALEETGQRENTLVIFTSDHGEMLGDHGLYLKGPHFYDAAVRVPLIMAWPGHFPAGRRSEALVELTDLAPTILEAAGLPVPKAMQGKSLLSLCEGRQDLHRHREHVYCEYYNAFIHKTAYATMLRTRNKKIVVYHGSEPGELYDLAADPGEFTNLWDSAAHRDLKAALMQRAFDMSVFTMDPLPERLDGATF